MMTYIAKFGLDYGIMGALSDYRGRGTAWMSVMTNYKVVKFNGPIMLVYGSTIKTRGLTRMVKKCWNKIYYE